jgi:hypothetical protein
MLFLRCIYSTWRRRAEEDGTEEEETGDEEYTSDELFE